MNVAMYVLCGIPALYFGGIFWGGVVRRLLAVSLFLIALFASGVALSAEWLAEKLGS